MHTETSTLRPLAAAALALFLGACTVGPDFVRPDVPVAERFANADPSAPAARRAATPSSGARSATPSSTR
jgi:hypothetical protein